jgi:hypothetical protein
VGTGCGGGGDRDSTEAKRSIQPEARERAKAIVLTLSDFPDGWRTASAEANEQAEEEFRRCLGVDFSPFTITGEAESKNFTMGEAAQVSSTAAVWESEEEAAAAFAARSEGMRSEAAADCWKEYFEANARGEGGEDFAVGEVERDELNITPAPGVDDVSGWQIVFPLEGSGEAEGVSVTAYLELFELREGDAGAVILTADTSSPFDQRLRDELLQTIASRMA